MDEQIEVVYFQRKPRPYHKSLEYIFNDVRSRLPSNVKSSIHIFNVYSTGILNRLRIIWQAYKNQGEVNHVTGDIHFATILLKRSQTLLTVLDCGVLSDSKGIRHLLLKYFWFTLPLKKCALVTVISTATKNELLKFVTYRPEDIYVIPVAISGMYQFTPKIFNKERPIILLIGTLPNKNLDRVLEAVKDIPCALNIIGPLSDVVKEKLNANNICYTNGVNLSDNQLLKQYVLCDILCFVSIYEGFGMPIVEANAVGRPVITSNILSMPEVAGKAACLVDPYNILEIRKGILKVMEDDQYRDDLISAGIENIKRFDADRIAEMYYSLYKKMACHSLC